MTGGNAAGDGWRTVVTATLIALAIAVTSAVALAQSTAVPTAAPSPPAVVDPAPAGTVATAPASVGPAVPPQPAEPRAAKVYATLDEFCARCHQTGRLKIPAPARPVANILALDEVALEPALVKPGIPDASALYTVLLRQHPALDLEALPGGDAIQAMRDWILDLPETTGRCTSAAPGRLAATEQAVTAALAAVPEDKRREIRFITLGHLVDACLAPATLDGYRQAITKVVNTLSWGPEPLRLPAIDPAGTILQLDLARLGWVAAHWDKLIQAYPYATLASSRLGDDIRKTTGTTTPLVRGDWLAHAALATPLYPRLLGLPGRMANLQRILNIDIEANILSAKARRGALGVSTITRANRLVERHPTSIGSLWLAYDFATDQGRQNLQNYPFGPVATAIVKVPFKHDGTRALFTLPNGFFAYSLNDARGDRLDASPESVDRDELPWAGPQVNGASCMSCHRTGPHGIKDSLRAKTEADAGLPANLREQILQLYAPQAELDSLIAEDQERYASAQRKAGIDPDLMLAGLEPVAALAREYTREVGLVRLAAEIGLSEAQTLGRLAALPAELMHSARRVSSATATRAEADRILIRLAPDAGPANATLVVAKDVESRGDFELLLWSRSQIYEAGQLATFHARANQACYLTLINLDRTGQATVLFPNEFEQNNLLAADTDLTLPAEGAAYQFRLRDKGRETLIGICQTVSKAPDGVQHDFERQRFTMLGDWRAHLGQVITPSARTTVEPSRPRPPRRGRGRPTPVAEPRSDARTGPDVQARTAIVYDVR
jgi:Domain of unknown function (DUF4384)